MRGSANNEGIVSQANTAEYEAGYDRIFGKGRKPQRGRWVFDEQLQRLVPADQYQPPEQARNAPVMVDRHYEGLTATDGTDIGSRRKHRAYMREHGLTTMDDFSGSWAKAEEKREAVHRGERVPIKGLRDTLGRAFYEIDRKTR